MHLFACVPTARGIHPQTSWGMHDMRTVLEKNGHYFHGSSVYRMPLDLARNEMHTTFLSTTADLCLLLDDDVWLQKPEQLVDMIEATRAGCEIISAPCLLRDHSNSGAQTGGIFNVRPTGSVNTCGRLILDECEWTGLGLVLVTRKAMKAIYDQEPVRYNSRIITGYESAPIYTSQIVPAKELQPEAPEGLNVYLLDDVAFSLKAKKAGFKIWAALNVATVHDGMAGCFTEAQEKLERSRMGVVKATARKSLLGPDGKPVG